MFGGASPGNSREKVLGHVGDGYPIDNQSIAVFEDSKLGRQKCDVCVAVRDRGQTNE